MTKQTTTLLLVSLLLSSMGLLMLFVSDVRIASGVLLLMWGNNIVTKTK